MIHTNVFYTKKGERLACFLDHTEDGNSLISVYRCSLDDQFNKKQILAAHLTKDPSYHPVVYKFDVMLTNKQFFEFLEGQYYRKKEMFMKAKVCLLKCKTKVKYLDVSLFRKMDA